MSPPTETVRSPEPTLRHAVRHVNRAFQAHVRERFARYGVSEAEYMAMFALRRIPDMSSADLARWTGVTAQGANQVLRVLLDHGLVERRRSVTHGRILEARLTVRGEEMIEACEREARAIEEQMTAGMSDAERATLERLLRECAEALGSPIDDRTGVPPRLQARADAAGA